MTGTMNYDKVKNKDDSLNNHCEEANFPFGISFASVAKNIIWTLHQRHQPLRSGLLN
jgi:hypothetical protein